MVVRHFAQKMCRLSPISNSLVEQLCQKISAFFVKITKLHHFTPLLTTFIHILWKPCRWPPLFVPLHTVLVRFLSLSFHCHPFFSFWVGIIPFSIYFNTIYYYFGIFKCFLIIYYINISISVFLFSLSFYMVNIFVFFFNEYIILYFIYFVRIFFKSFLIFFFPYHSFSYILFLCI